MTALRPLVRSAAAVLILVLASAPPAHAQDLPDAHTILARFHEAVGGIERLSTRTAVRSMGEYAVPAARINARFESLMSAPGMRIMRVDVPGFGEIRTGYVDGVAWSMNPAEGPRIVQGAEAVQSADEADVAAQFRLPSAFAALTTVERTTRGGHECYLVRLTWKSGRETFDCYSTETGLLVGMNVRQVSSSGTADAEYLYDDYRAFDGVLMPGRVVARTAGIEQVLTRSAVSFDAIPASAFEPPAEVRALMRP
jgi:hypothetical protein